MNTNECRELIKIMDDAFKTFGKKPIVQELNIWINNVVNNIRLLNKLLRNESLSCGRKNNIIATIGILKAKNRKFKKLKKRGLGFKKNERWIKWEEMENAFEGRIRTGLVVNLKHKNLECFFSDAKKMIIKRLKNTLKKLGNLKVNVILAANFSALEEGKEIDDIKFFNTKNAKILESTNFDEWFESEIREKFLVKIDNFQQKKSGWSLKEIINLQVNINKYVSDCSTLSS